MSKNKKYPKKENTKKWLRFVIVGFILNFIGLAILVIIVPNIDNRIDLNQDEIDNLEEELNRRLRNYQEIIRYQYLTSMYETNYTILSHMDENKENKELLEFYYEKWKGFIIDELGSMYAFYYYGKTDLSELPDLVEKWKSLDISKLKEEKKELNKINIEHVGSVINNIFDQKSQKKDEIHKLRTLKATMVPIGAIFQLIGVASHAIGIYLGKTTPQIKK